MVVETRNYTFPISGAMKNWETLSGDDNNPLKARAFQQFTEDTSYLGAWQQKAMDYDFNTGEVVCDVIAEESVLDNFEAWYRIASGDKKRGGEDLVKHNPDVDPGMFRGGRLHIFRS